MLWEAQAIWKVHYRCFDWQYQLSQVIQAQVAETEVKKPPDDSSPWPFEISPDKDPDFVEER